MIKDIKEWIGSILHWTGSLSANPITVVVVYITLAQVFYNEQLKYPYYIMLVLTCGMLYNAVLLKKKADNAPKITTTAPPRYIKNMKFNEEDN